MPGKFNTYVKNNSNDKQPTRFYSKKQENAVAKAVGGKTTANSGATMFGGKGDVVTSGSESFLIECKTKTTSSDSISIKKSWFLKNKQEAIFTGKEHTALVFNFGPDEENHYIIDEYLFKELLEHLKENN